jgi:hypothetical protein
MSSKKNVRRYERVSLPKGTPVAWEHSGKRNVSTVGVLALGGLFIATPTPPPNGDSIKLVFDAPSGEVRARALICDSQPGKGMGIEFTSMDPAARTRLQVLLKTLAKVPAAS